MPSRKKPKSSDLTRCSSSSWAGSSSGVTRLRTSSASSGGPEGGVRLPVTRNMARGRQVEQLVERGGGLRSARGGAFLAGRGAIQLGYDFGKFFRVVFAHWMFAIDGIR